MPSWEDRFDAHELWEKVDVLRNTINGIEAPEGVDARDTLEYATAMAALVAQRRRETSALQISSATLEATATAVDNVNSYLAGWSQDETYNEAQVDTQIGALADALAAWPPMVPEQLVEAQRDASARIAQATTEALDSVAAKRDELSETLTKLAARQIDLEEKIAEQTTEIATAVATFQSQAKDELAAATKSWASEREEQNQRAEANLEVLHDLEQQARDLVHAATGSVVATDYGAYARRETRSGWICDIAAALVGCIGVTAILYHLFAAEPDADGSIGLSLTRLAASIAALGVAALVGKRGSQHHHEARAAKRTDLAIRQVGPFVSNLKKDDRELVVKEVTDRVFIKGELDHASPREDLVEKISRLRRESKADAGSSDS